MLTATVSGDNEDQIKDNIDYFAEYLHKEGDMPLIRYLFFPRFSIS